MISSDILFKIYSEVSNTFYLEDGKIKYTFDALPKLDNIKHDLSLIKDFNNRVCYIESSRGCFYNCTYCLASTEKPVRYFPLEEVLGNIKYLLDNNARTIKFLDRSFGVKREYIDTILKFILDNLKTFDRSRIRFLLKCHLFNL